MARGNSEEHVSLDGARPDGAVVSRRLGDDVVLVHLHTNRIYSLNETGARLWELLCKGLNGAAIQEELLKEFEVERVELQAEIDRLLGELSREGLLRSAN